MPEKPIRFTPHAEENLIARSISREEVEETIRNPDRDEDARPPRRVASRQYFDDVLNKEMLLRVITEETADGIQVITLYKTSKITKYLVP
jgi:hypothetical protein